MQNWVCGLSDFEQASFVLDCLPECRVSAVPVYHQGRSRLLSSVVGPALTPGTLSDRGIVSVPPAASRRSRGWNGQLDMSCLLTRHQCRAEEAKMERERPSKPDMSCIPFPFLAPCFPLRLIFPFGTWHIIFAWRICSIHSALRFHITSVTQSHV